MNKTISFIGAGKMATALISSIYKNYGIIANGRKKNTLFKILNNEEVGTIFYPKRK